MRKVGKNMKKEKGGNKMYNENETDAMLKDIEKLQDENEDLKRELGYYISRYERLKQVVENIQDYIETTFSVNNKRK